MRTCRATAGTTILQRNILSCPTIRAQTIFRQSDGLNKIINRLKRKRSEIKLAPHVINHAAICLASGICILRDIGVLAFVAANVATRDEIVFAARTRKIYEMARIKQRWTSNAHMRLTSANSINVARFLPQAFYYFYAYAQMKRQGKADELVICVPSGNFGNLCAGLFAHRMGLPIKRFIAANNRNDVFFQYLQSGEYNPRASVQTIANAMDVGDPSNFARILDLYGHSHKAICDLISGATYTDEQIAATVADTYHRTGYLLDPHGACGYRALTEMLQPGEQGVFLETAHPAKFCGTVETIVKSEVVIPEKLQAFMRGTKQSVAMTAQFEDFKAYLMRR